MMHNAVNNQTPNYLSSRFFLRNEALTYNPGNTEGKLFLPQPRTNYCKRNFSYSGAVLWNSLPNLIELSSTLDEFKNKLKNHTVGSSSTFGIHGILVKQVFVCLFLLVVSLS